MGDSGLLNVSCKRKPCHGEGFALNRQGKKEAGFSKWVSLCVLQNWTLWPLVSDHFVFELCGQLVCFHHRSEGRPTETKLPASCGESVDILKNKSSSPGAFSNGLTTRFSFLSCCDCLPSSCLACSGSRRVEYIWITYGTSWTPSKFLA